MLLLDERSGLHPYPLDGEGRLVGIAAGMDADLAVLGPDRQLRDLMARGHWMVREGKPVVRSPFDAPAAARSATTWCRPAPGR